ncbi:MAG: sulfopyruvate decarboxylase subunit alpha [Nitrospirota bacterium]
MYSAEDNLLEILKTNSIDYVSTLPCDRIKLLLERIKMEFPHVPLTREEEGVGISAGMALAGKRPAMFVQSSGIGNMINALLSLTGFYHLPLAIFVSQRGIYKEAIAAQFPMGEKLPGILRGARLPFSTIRSADDIDIIAKKLPHVFKKDKIHAFLMSPAVFEETESGAGGAAVSVKHRPGSHCTNEEISPASSPVLTRYQMLDAIAPHLDSKIVVCNLGIPSKELYVIRHESSNFYMLGSMGMATPIGLGISLSTDREVVVIDGDGSILMNPGTLATAAHLNPPNLTILAVDNGSYGSTGEQPTLTGSCVDLALLARGCGILNIVRAARRKQLVDAVKWQADGLKFIHALALPGNAKVKNIPLHHLDMKKEFMDWISGN